MRSLHLVLIENDAELLDAQRKTLEQAGYRITALRSVEKLEQLLELRPDAFVLDEHLPYISGHIICIYLRSKPETARTPLLLTSVHPQLQTFAGLCNASAWLKKPFDQYDLLEKVSEILKHEQRPVFHQN